MKWSPSEVILRVTVGLERALIALAAYLALLILTPRTLAVAEMYMPVNAEALAAAAATLLFFSGFFNKTIFGKAADAARDILIIVVLALTGGKASFTIQEVYVTADASLIIAILIAACAVSLASTIISAIGQMAEE